jgi:ABC-type dipeptide/oligopeptide/nickel transport system permease component
LTAFVVRRLLLSLFVLLAVSYGSFVLIATQFSSTCYSNYTPTGAYPPLADSVGHATTLWLKWLRQVPSGKAFHVQCSTQGTEDVVGGLEHTGALLGMTLVFVLLASLVIGVFAALRAGGWSDFTFRAFSYTAWAVPPFLLALVLQSALLSMTHHGWHLFPISGWPDSGCSPTVFVCTSPPHVGIATHTAKVLQALVVPAIALSIAFIGLHSRYLRSSLLVAFGAPYTNTARAKGLSERRIVLRHALRNSVGVFVSVLLLDLGAVIGASLAVDYVFRLGGLGLVFLGMIGGLGSQSGDGPKFLDPYAVMSLLMVTAILVAVASLVAELIVVWLDPRVRPA